MLWKFVVDRNRSYVTITATAAVATRVASPIVIATAARTATHRRATYAPRGSSGYQEAYGS